MIENSLQYFERGLSLCNYVSVRHGSDSLSDQIRELKTLRVDPHTSHPLIDSWSKWLINSIALPGDKYDVIIRVPGHDELLVDKSKAIHMIAQNVAVSTGCMFVEHMLLKKDPTEPQRNIDPILDVDRRMLNTQDSFKVDKNYRELNNKRILIIDDVITTGATLVEVGRALNTTNSTNKLYFFTLASAAREQA